MEKEIILKLDNLHCSSCIMNIEMVLEEMDGISDVSGSYSKSEVKITFNPEKADQKKIVEEIQKLGYAVSWCC